MMNKQAIANNLLGNEEVFLSNLYVGLRPCTVDGTLTRTTEFDGIQAYLYARVEIEDEEESGTASVKVNEELLNHFCIEVDKAWEIALSNVCGDTCIIPMKQIMEEEVGMALPDDIAPPLYVVTNHSRFKGASTILNKGRLKRFAMKKGVDKLLVLPSSIHEMLILSYTDDMEDIEMYKAMVTEINESQVEPHERLTNNAYILNF